MASQNLPAKEAFADVRSLLERAKTQIGAALPPSLGLTPERIVRIALTSVRQNPDLLRCDRASFVGAVIQAAQLGLEPGGALGHAYLIPFKGKVQFIPGYRGLIDLARRSGNIISIAAHVVYENDDFDFEYGLNEKLVHRPRLNGDRGKPIAVYAVAHLTTPNGQEGYGLEVMSVADVNKIKAGAPSGGKSGPWTTHWDEMARKTVIRRLVKYLPVSVDLQRAVALDEMADAGVDQGLDLDDGVIDVTGEAPTDPTAEATDNQAAALKNKLKGAKGQEAGDQAAA